MHARQDDDLGIDLHRFPSQRQAVAHDVGDAVEDFRRHIIVRQDHRVPLFFQRQDRVDIVREHRPLDGRNDGSDLVVQLRCTVQHCGVEHGCGPPVNARYEHMRVMLRRSISLSSTAPSQSALAWKIFFGLACAVTVAPLFLTDVPPLLDYPNHLARMFVLVRNGRILFWIAATASVR